MILFGLSEFDLFMTSIAYSTIILTTLQKTCFNSQAHSGRTLQRKTNYRTQKTRTKGPAGGNLATCHWTQCRIMTERLIVCAMSVNLREKSKEHLRKLGTFSRLQGPAAEHQFIVAVRTVRRTI